MKKISLDHSPSFVAVLDGRTDLLAAMSRARDCLLNPVYQAVVIVRNSPTLSETASRSEKMLGSLGTHYNSVGRLPDGRFAELGLGDDIVQIYDDSKFRALAGDDIADVLNSIKASFSSPTSIDIRCADGANSVAHLDSGREYESANDNLSRIFSNPNSKYPSLPGGTTLTIAVRGGGTLIAPLDRDALDRVRGEGGKMIWNLRCEDSEIEPDHGWQVGDGDICLMRAGDWPETHLPGLHASPPRERPLDPKERLVGVAFL